MLPLADGTVRVRDCDLEFSFDSPGNWFERHLRDSAFDVFEFSIAHYLITHDRPRPQWDWIGVPVFLSKALADLKWFVGRSRTHSQGVLLGIDEKPLPNIRMRWLYEAGALDRLLRTGQLDAAFATDEEPIDVLDPVLRPLFPDGGRALVGDFFARRGFEPVNHTVLLRRPLAEEHPWLPEALYAAFEASKQEAYRRDPSTRCIFPVQDAQDAAEQRERFGEDPFASGLAANRDMLVMAAQQSVLEGTIRELPRIDDLFHPAVRAT